MATYYEIVTPPIAEPLSLADAKAFLRVETDADDDLIDALILSAISSAEKYTNRIFRPTTFRVSQTSGQCLRLLRSPVTALTSISSWNGTAFAAITDTIYHQSNFFPSITLPDAVLAPSNAPFGIQAVFVAGYATLPPDLLQALKVHVNYLYENRGDVEADDTRNEAIPLAAKMIYRQYRIISTYG